MNSPQQFGSTYVWVRHPSPGRAALFLDRDGVLIADRGYVGQSDRTSVLPGVPGAVAEATRIGLTAVMVTNQSGIERGYYGWDGFEAVNAVILEQLDAEGGTLHAILACSATPEADHPWRKPGPGMFQAAAASVGVDLRRSWMVGDRHTDLRAAQQAGLLGGHLIGPPGPITQQQGFLARSAPTAAAAIRAAIGLLIGVG